MAQKGIRREKGSGSVFLRSNGRYLAKYPIGRNKDGEIQYRNKTFSTKKEATRWLEEQKEEYKTLSALDIQVMTVEEYMNKWLYTNKVNELKPTSFDRVEQVYKFQVLPHIGKIQISQLRSEDIQKMISSLRDGGYSYSTIKKAYECCNNCFTTGVKQRTLAFNPCDGVTIPRKSQFAPNPIRFYTEEEEEKIILAARSVYSNRKRVYRLGDIVPFVFNTGIRLAECLALKWTDIDWKKKTAFIHASRVTVKDRDPDAKHKNKVIEQDSLLTGDGTKTRSSTRTVFLNEDAVEALQGLYLVTGNFEYVLATENGNPVAPRNLDRMFRKIIVAAGLPEDKVWGLHSVRHTFTSSLIREGADVKLAAEMLGHKETSVTLDTYTHIINEQKRQIAKAISQKKRKNKEEKD